MNTSIAVRRRITPLMLSRAELTIVAVYGLYCLLAGLLLATQPVASRWAIALPLAFLGLGWQITYILMPVTSGLDLVERGAVAGVLSMGVGGACALLLARTSYGLQPHSLLAVLVSLSGLFVVLGLLRQPDIRKVDERRGQETAVTSVSDAMSAQDGREKTPLHRAFRGAVVILLCGVLASGWFLFSNAQVQSAADPSFTEFYLLDSRGYLVEDPVVWLADGRALLRYGIGNHEGTLASYRVCVATSLTDMNCSEPLGLDAGDEQQGMLVLDVTPYNPLVTVQAAWPANRFVMVQERSPVKTSVDILLLRDEQLCRTLRLWIDR